MMQHRVPTRVIGPLAISTLVTVTTVLALQLNFHYGNGAIQRDVFRHFYVIVIPLLDGDGGLASLVHNHHASPLFHVHQLVSMWLFDSSQRADAYIGVLLFCLIALYLANSAMADLRRLSGTSGFALMVALGIALLVSSPSAGYPVSWPLIFLQAYLFALGLLVAAATWHVSTSSPNGPVLYLCSVVLAMVCHSSYGMLFTAASVVALCLQALARRRYRLFAMAACAMLFAYLWLEVILPALGHVEPGRRGPVELLHRPLEWPLILAAFGKAFLAGFHGDGIVLATIDNKPSAGQWPLFLGAAFAYVVATLWAVLSPRRVMVAGIFMLAMGAGVLAAMLARNGLEEGFPYKLDAPRYILIYRMAAAAFLWSAGDALAALWRIQPGARQGLRSPLNIIALPLLAAIVLLQLAAFDAVRDRRAEMRTLQAANELLIYMQGVDTFNDYNIRGWPGGSSPEQHLQQVVTWLHAEQLNVFSPHYRPSVQFRDYQRGRALFHDGRARLLDTGTQPCLSHDGSGAEQAFEAVVSASATGRFALEFSGRETERRVYQVKSGKQRIYGILPADTAIRLCLPKTATLVSMRVSPTDQ